MPKTYTINQSSINPRPRHSKSQPPKLTKEQREHLNLERKKKNEAIKSEVEQWLKDTLQKADDMVKLYGRSRRYLLDMFFQGGVKLVRPRNKPNAYNAFKWWKSRENREEGGPSLDVEELDEAYREEYEDLEDDELEEIVKTYEKERGPDRDSKEPVLPLNTVRLPTACARARDVSNVATNMAKMLEALALRVRVEGMFLVLEAYMPFAIRGGWDTEKVGARVKAFAVAGLETANLAKTSRDKAILLRGEICALMRLK
ncbi:hypothetical protein V5O48_014361 [Marasmius crinis-equi]|uniref:Uncharacterized protein n=1 Tax=Marasmius crinis-equi TaxID=585013 RepID=A0ABR3EXI9_9AGAR